MAGCVCLNWRGRPVALCPAGTGKKQKPPQIRDFELDVAAQRVYLSPRQPFDFLAEVAVIAARLAGPDGAIPSGHSVWLAFLDAYRTKCVAPQSAFRRVLDELVRLEAV